MFGKGDLLVLILLLGVVSAGVAFRVNKGNLKDQMLDEIKFDLETIQQSCIKYEAEKQEYPGNISTLIASGYLELEPTSLDQWVFTVYPKQMILAESNSNNPLGKGKRIALDIERDLFLGFEQNSRVINANDSSHQSNHPLLN